MKKQKNKMTDSVIIKLKMLAEDLPPMPKLNPAGEFVYKPATVDGQELLNSGALDYRGNPGIPGQKYKSKVLVYRDHNQELREYYQKNGIEATEKMVDVLHEVYNDKLKKMNQAQPLVADPVARIVNYITDRKSDLMRQTLLAKDLATPTLNSHLTSELNEILKFIKS